MLLAIASGAAAAAWAQDASVNADAVRKAILAVPIWHVDRSTGTSFWHFEMRGDKLWANAVNNSGVTMGDVLIEVISDGLTWIDPGGQQITLHYDPQDIQFPFKGADSQGRTYEFTPK